MYPETYIINLIRGTCLKWNIPALSYGFIIDGKLTTFGNIGNVDEHTLFRIGSNGKSMASALLLRVLQMNKMTVYDYLTDICEEIAFSDKNLGKQIQLKDILAHSAGHGKFTCSMMAYLGYFENDIIKSFEHIPFSKAPGVSFQYHNGLYLLAHKLIEYISKIKTEEYFKQKLFEPVGMCDTSMGLRNTDLLKLATPYNETDGGAENIRIAQSPFSDAIGAGGNISSSAFDLSKWVLKNLLISRGSEESIVYQQFFPYVIFKQELNPDFCLNKLIKWNGYGLGWYLNSYKHHKLIEHLGGVPGYTSFMSFSPNLNAGIVLLCNKTDMRFPLEYLRVIFYNLLTGNDSLLCLESLYTQTSGYKERLSKQLLYTKKSLPQNLKNNKFKFYNPQYKNLALNIEDEAATICFESTGYSFPLAYVGDGCTFIAEDSEYNFKTTFKRVLFKLKHKQLNMQVYMDNQQGELMHIEDQVFHRI